MISYGISNTGPLISAFQAQAIDLMKQVVKKIYITPSCLDELYRHGWQEETDAEMKREFLEICHLTEDEKKLAQAIAEAIALKSQNKDKERHLGEAETLALASRATFKEYPVLLEDSVARAIAKERNQKLSGFAGLLIQAVEKRIITPEQAKQLLTKCQQQGTRYTSQFIESAYEMCKGVYK